MRLRRRRQMLDTLRGRQQTSRELVELHLARIARYKMPRRYGKWVARLYQQALSCGEPLLEDVDAVVMWPDQPRQSYRYRRLVLPFKRRDGSSVLLGTTLHDPDIDLRIKRNQELLQVLQ